MAFKLRGPGGSGMMGSRPNPNKLRRQMTQEHPDILQNIEFVLLSAYRRDKTIDDAACLQAVQAALGGETPSDEGVRGLVQGIADIRALIRTGEASVSDELWNDCLLVVGNSIKFWSTLNPGARGYLDYVLTFII